jgi:hypothetical protein
LYLLLADEFEYRHCRFNGSREFQNPREVAIAIDGLKTAIEGIKGQLALMSLVFAGYAAASLGAFGYFFVDSRSGAMAIVRIETRQEAQNTRLDGIEKRLDGIERRLDHIVGIIQPPKQQGQLEGRPSAGSVGGRQ